MKNFTTKKINILTLIFWLALWQILSMIISKPLLLPSIPETVIAFIEMLKVKTFYLDVFATITRCIASIAISFVLGVIFALLSARKRWLEVILKGPVSFFKTVPVMAIIIYFIILVESNFVAVLVAFLMCFPVCYQNTLEGLKAVNIEYVELGKVYGLTKMQMVKYIYLPSISSQLKSALSLIAGLSWKAVIAAEVLSIPARSIGYEMMNAKYYLNTAELFAYILVVILLSILMEKGIKAISIKEFALKLDERPKEGKVNIYLEDVDKSYGDRKVLTSYNFSLIYNKVETLKAPSGSGKTTVARIIAGLEDIDKGKIHSDGKVLLSYLFQEDRLLPWMNVYDNIYIGVRNREKILDILSELELSEYIYSMPDELSGGLKHRVALARALASEANVLILDEPFRGLDDELKGRILDRCWEKYTLDKAVLLITHDEGLANTLG
ncbi:MAG: ATP-binding cassette domain-containing protein [Clostridia bacterium]|nr:ATP-binding cassette domain-containing protein [Clostridia bacterium]